MARRQYRSIVESGNGLARAAEIVIGRVQSGVPRVQAEIRPGPAENQCVLNKAALIGGKEFGHLGKRRRGHNGTVLVRRSQTPRDGHRRHPREARISVKGQSADKAWETSSASAAAMICR